MAIDIEQPRVLTADNYYDDFTYMSTSRFKEFIKCPSCLLYTSPSPRD